MRRYRLRAFFWRLVMFAFFGVGMILTAIGMVSDAVLRFALRVGQASAAGDADAAGAFVLAIAFVGFAALILFLVGCLAVWGSFMASDEFVVGKPAPARAEREGSRA